MATKHNRVVIALDLGEWGKPADEVVSVLQRVAATGDWYLARDPRLQIDELLREHDSSIRVGRQGDGYRATLELTPSDAPKSQYTSPITASGETIDDALKKLYDEARREHAIEADRD